MNLFRSSIASFSSPSSSTSSCTAAATDPPTASRLSTSTYTGPNTGGGGLFPHPGQPSGISRSTSTSTATATVTPTPSSPAPANTPTAGGSTSSSAPITSSRVLSAFNPTKTYFIPSHGGILPRRPLHIYDLTPRLRNRKPAADSYSDRKAFKREVRDILKRWRETSKARAKKDNPSNNNNNNNGVSEKGKEPDLWSDDIGELDTAAVVTSSRGVKTLQDVETGGSARWSVPWALWKEIVVEIEHPGGRTGDAGVWTHDFDPRSQIFEARGASYRWRFVTPRELVLEKRAPGMGRYVVAVFYLTRGAGTTEGTLLFDERGVDRVLVVSTVLVALKRERQRWGVLGGTV